MSVRHAVLWWVFLNGLLSGAEPPAIRRQGIVNAASQRPAAVGGAIARGSLIAIFGVRFASAIGDNQVALAGAGPVRRLTVLHADPQRLDAWIPADAPPGAARITVRSKGFESSPEAVTIWKAAPGLFSANGEGWGPARADDLTGAAPSANTTANSVAPGGRLMLLATGLRFADRPEIRVGNARVRVISIEAPRGPTYTAKITIEIPAAADEGCYVPVYARVVPAPPSNTVTISVHRGGGNCVGTPDDPASGWKGGKTAIVALYRTVRRTMEAPEDQIEDQMNAAFFDVPAGKARASPLLLMPPPGGCATYAGVRAGGTPVGSSIWTLQVGGDLGEGLDAGNSLSIRNQTVQLRAPFVTGAAGLYRRNLSGRPGRVSPRDRLSLDAGRLGVVGSGGAQVGPFAISLPAPTPFVLANPLKDSIPRSRAMTVEWNAGNSGGTMAIILFGADVNLNVVGVTYCNAPKAAGRFTIPADLLAQLPAGRGNVVLVSWWGRVITPAPVGIARMMALSVFARSLEVHIE